MTVGTASLEEIGRLVVQQAWGAVIVFLSSSLELDTFSVGPQGLADMKKGPEVISPNMTGGE